MAVTAESLASLEIDPTPSATWLIALIGTVLLALLIMLAPPHRAVHVKPGEAIRYA